MNSDESKQIADLIWSKLFSKQSAIMTKQCELNAIESVIIKVAQEQRKIGRNQVLNHFKIEIENYK